MAENLTIDPNVPLKSVDDKSDEPQGPTYNEGGNEGADVIVMSGPLGEVYTKALQVYFAKKPIDVTAVTESQAIDESMVDSAMSAHVSDELSNVAKGIKLQTTEDVVLGNVTASVFAVDKANMNRPEIVNHMERLNKISKENNRKTVFLVHLGPLDEAKNIYDHNKVVELNPIEDSKNNYFNVGCGFTAATECIVENMGMDVVYGMEGFAVWVIDNYKKKKKPRVAQEGIIDKAKEFLGKFFKKNGATTQGEKEVGSHYSQIIDRLKKAKATLEEIKDEEDLVVGIPAFMKEVVTNKQYVDLTKWYGHVLGSARENSLRLIQLQDEYVKAAASYTNDHDTKKAQSQTNRVLDKITVEHMKMLGATGRQSDRNINTDVRYVVPSGMDLYRFGGGSTFLLDEDDEDDTPILWPVAFLYNDTKDGNNVAIVKTMTLVDDDVSAARSSMSAAIDGAIKMFQLTDPDADCGDLMVGWYDVCETEDTESFIGEVVERAYKAEYIFAFIKISIQLCRIIENIK